MDDPILDLLDDLARDRYRPRQAVQYHVGDLVWYILAPPGSTRLLYAAAVVVRLGFFGRYGIATVLDRRVRYVSGWRLSKLPPPSNVDVQWSEQCRPPLSPGPDAA